MDFLGIGRRTSKGSHCQKDPLPEINNSNKSMHYLSRVTPQMIQKVLAFRGFCEEMRAAASDQNGSASAKSIPAALQQHHHHLAGKAASSANPARSASEESSTQLTVFYNGTVSVYEVSADQAQAIMSMLSETGNSRQPAPDSGLAKTSGSENQAGGAKGIEKLRKAELPLARKQSLQRFLEKRKQRLKSASPYQAGATLASKLVEEEREIPFQRWVGRQ